MHEQNSYGTGRQPQRRSHLALVLLLLALFGASYLIPLLLPSPDAPDEEPTQQAPLHLPERIDAETQLPLPDGCGLGLRLGELTEPQRKYWTLPGGVFIEQIEPNSPAYAAGLREGDILLQVGDTNILSTHDCIAALEALQAQPELPLYYYRDGVRHCVTLPLSDFPEASS